MLTRSRSLATAIVFVAFVYLRLFFVQVYVDEALGVLVERANLVRERERAGGARVKTVHVRSSVVCFESVDSPVIGHPFLDALRFAFVHECAFVLNPHTLWTLVADALAGFFRDMPTLCTMIEARRAEVADFADGRARFFIDTPSSEISEDPIGALLFIFCLCDDDTFAHWRVR